MDVCVIVVCVCVCVCVCACVCARARLCERAQLTLADALPGFVKVTCKCMPGMMSHMHIATKASCMVTVAKLICLCSECTNGCNWPV